MVVWDQRRRLGCGGGHPEGRGQSRIRTLTCVRRPGSSRVRPRAGRPRRRIGHGGRQGGEGGECGGVGGGGEEMGPVEVLILVRLHGGWVQTQINSVGPTSALRPDVPVLSASLATTNSFIFLLYFIRTLRHRLRPIGPRPHLLRLPKCHRSDRKGQKTRRTMDVNTFQSFSMSATHLRYNNAGCAFPYTCMTHIVVINPSVYAPSVA